VFEQFGDIEESVLILAMSYLNDILSIFDLEEGSFLKGMYATCVLLAHKYLVETEYWPVQEFSKMVGVSSNQITQWENQILSCLEYKLYASEEVFAELRSELLSF